MRSNTNLSKQSANNLDFDIVDDDDDKTELNQVKPWKLLVVDDDDEVHESTTFALSSVKILDRSLELLHARSASEGFNLLAKHPDCAVALLDVVMESEDAGLKLVEKIRSHGHLELRIILRTGQPGYAPEISVLTEYDINDYRTKSELTRTRLISALTTAIRSYRQLHIINESRRGLSLIVKSSSDIFKRKNFELFAQGVLTQLSGLLGQKNEGLVCIQEKGQNSDESTQKISNLKEDQIIQDIPSANQNNTQKNISKIKGASEDQRFIVVTATQKFAQFVNQDLNQIKDEQVSLVLGKAQRADLGVHINGHLGLYFQARDGKKLFVYLDEVNTNLGDEYISLLKIFANNISVSFENLALIERLDQLAYQDAILGLPNRNAFSQSYNQLAKTQPYFSVIALHIDSLGQSIGVFGIALVNQALLLIHNKLSQLLNPHIIAYDGKADLLIISQNPNRDLETIQSFFKNKLEVGQVQLALNVRIAVVDADENSDADLALRNIVSTMAHSKASGNVSVNYYDQSITTGLARRLKLQSALSDAVEQRKGIETFLQAKVRCIDSEIVGAEALCRWHFEEQYVSPCDFIPIAEASGLITSLTDIVLENVSNFALDRRKKGLKPLSVAVNLSVHSFLNNNFADQLLAKVQSLGLNKQELEFEITESVVMSDPKQVIEQLKKINNAGFKLAIDDFGTGYSSLNYLDQLPVQCIKIDKAFVDPLNISNARGSLAATAISMAEQLKMYVVAEGIETKQQHDALTFLGCDVCQGYYFAKPQSFSDFRHGLDERGLDGSALVNSFH